MYMVCKLDGFIDEATCWLYIFLLHMYICLHEHAFDMGFYCMVILRSTTGPYGRLILEVAYGETLLSLHRGCMGDDSSGRVVGVST